MRKIHFTVSLEQFTSRIPGFIPAFDSDGNYHIFTKDAILARKNRFPNNYGMLPISIDISDFFIKHPGTKIAEGKLSYDGKCIVSYRRLDDWFHFFTQYYDLLNNHGSCGRAYTSATEYYKNEVNSKTGFDALYGNDITAYEDMDSFFNSHGGKVVIKENNALYGYDTEELNIPAVATDEGLFKYMLDNLFLKFYIPKDYRDVWGVSYLWFGDAVKWNSWFFNRRKIYDNIDVIAKCPTSDNCCDCEEYFKRGGRIMGDMLSEWVSKANIKAEQLSQMYDENPYLNPTSIHSFNIQQSIENMGEMSIFSNDWKSGVDYINTQSDSKEGTVVIYNNKAYIIRSKKDIINTTQNISRTNRGKTELFGYKFEEKYLERVWGNSKVNIWDGNQFTTDDSNNDNHWKDYTSYYILSHENDFNVQNRYILKDYKGTYKKIYTDDIETAKKICDDINSVSYTYDTKKCVVINNIIYPVIKGKYIILNDKIYEVETNGINEYIVINSSKLFLKDNKVNNISAIEGYFINYNGEYILCENDSLTISDANINYTYKVFDAHVMVSSMNLYIKDRKAYKISNNLDGDINSGFKQTTEDITSSITDGTIYKNIIINEDDVVLVYNYELEEVNDITGYTESKLDLLKPNVRYYDDIGNEMHGFNPTESIVWDGSESMSDNNGVNPLYSQPSEGTVLKPYYNIGNTTSLSVLTGDKYKPSNKFYNGNIITDMEFYCTDDEGKVISGKYKNIDSLKAINALITGVGNITKDKHLKCNITYHLNATLIKDNDTFTLANGYSEGIKFEETVEFIKKQDFFNTSTTTKILVWYYDIKHETDILKSGIYNHEWESSRARFSLPYINLGSRNDIIDMDDTNNTVVLPLFREEYRFGNSLLQNINSNIYIDKGVNYAFDKHLKLGEISSFESLENYSNGYFNIIDS